MIFLVSKEHRERDALAVEHGERLAIFSKMLTSSGDMIVEIDDYPNQTTTMKYLNIDYRAVIGVPDLPASTSLIYETDKQRFISYDDFNKIMKVGNSQVQDIKEHLEKPKGSMTMDEDIDEEVNTD